MRSFFSIALFALFFFGVTVVAVAQDLAPDPSRTAIMKEEQEAQKEASAAKTEEAMPAQKKEPVDISKATDAQIQEAQRFYKSCTKNEELNLNHDCRCLAGEFLASRISMGDSAAAKQVYATVRGLCLKDPNEKVPDAEVDEAYTDDELKEAEKIYQLCNGNQLMKLNHDCRCMAALFIDKRRERGRIPQFDEILGSMNNECKNGTDMAGYLYTDCINKPEFVPFGVKDVKKFCECYASGYAKEYERTTANNTVQTRSQIGMIVMGTCSNAQRGMEGATTSQ